MRVSIITPCYNGAQYLPACLESVLAQTMKDFEVLVIDDGSRDASFSIAQDFERRDARVHAFHQENAGVSAARNLGLEKAQGEWITFVDSDDLLPPDALETLLSGVRDGVDLVVCAHETFDGEGAKEMFFPDTHWYKKQGDARKRAAAFRLMEGDCVLNIMCGKLIRRELVEHEHLRLEEGLKIAEDALFNLEAVLAGRETVYVNRSAYRYRMHAASATKTRTSCEWDAHEPWLKAMRRMLERRGLMGKYYAPFLNSAVLRLYKDVGIGGVKAQYAKKVLPILPKEPLENKTLYGQLLGFLNRHGMYPALYPLFWAGQTFARKLGGLAARLRAAKERPE